MHMRMLSHTRLFQAAVVAAGIVAFSTTDALARSRGSWGSHGSSGSSASYGSYGSSGSSASYASSASYGSYGSSGSSASSGGRPGLFARWHARKAAKHSSGSSASYASSASYGSYGSSGSSASYASSGSYGGYAAPMYYEESAPAEVAPEAAADGEASIRVVVPADAKVYVNDRATTSTGAERSYVSRGLRGGRTYAYQLRVEFERDGETVVENKLVRLHAGEQVDLSFGGEQLAADQEATTELTLHVPAEAKVTLAGAPTRQTGESRTYATTALTAGQEWSGYVVRVEMERDGQTLVEEKTLSIVGGESYELTFDFAEPGAQVASLN